MISRATAIPSSWTQLGSGTRRTGLESEAGKMPGWAVRPWALRVNYGTRVHGTATNHGAVKDRGKATPTSSPFRIDGLGPGSGFKMIGLYDVSFPRNAADAKRVTQEHVCECHVCLSSCMACCDSTGGWASACLSVWL